MPPLAFTLMARTIPPTSMPGFVQKVLSSIEMVAACILWGTWSSAISSRRSVSIV